MDQAVRYGGRSGPSRDISGAPNYNHVSETKPVTLLWGFPVILAIRWDIESAIMISPMPRPAVASWHTRESVLVVDDDGDIRAFLTEALEEAGYEVRSARDGYAALTTLSAWRPGVVLLDLRMPRMDGWALCEQLAARSDLREVAVVAMSTRDNLAGPIAGVEPHARLEKPIDVPELLATLWVATNP